MGAVVLFAYAVIAADLWWRTNGVAVLIASSVFGAGLVFVYVLLAPRLADRIDRAMLVPLAIILVACVLSAYPRQSFDAALGALLHVGALFVLRGILSKEEARRLFLTGMMALSALLTLVVAPQVIGPHIEWWSLTGWSVTPPLDLRIRAEPWGLRYEVALLLVLLYPSWWVGSAGRLRAIGGSVVGIFVALVCLITGSRSIWLAVISGAAVVVLPRLRPLIHRRSGQVGIGVLVGVVLATVIFAPGAWMTFGERVGRVGSILERVSVWRPSLAVWADNPIAGTGPGSFPWILQGSGYFDTHSFAPRHPDSVAIQLLAEGGLLAVVAAIGLAVVVLPAVARSRSRAAVFVIVTWLVAGLALNPINFEPLTAVLIGWVALAVPRDDGARRSRADGQRRWPRIAVLAATALIGVAFTVTTVAAAAYAAGREEVAQGRLADAQSFLELATLLDPGLAIYPRQLGAIQLLTGAPDSAARALERAVGINPSDDLAWRVLGIAYAEGGRRGAAVSAYREAASLQRSDPTNLLLLAREIARSGDEVAARRLIAEVVQAWPTVVAAPGWGAYAVFAGEDVIMLASERWTAGRSSPEPRAYQPRLLRIMTGARGASAGTEAGPHSESMDRAYDSVMRCDQRAPRMLASTDEADRRHPTYWELATRQAALSGGDPAVFIRVHEIMTHLPLLADPEHGGRMLNPLDENGSRESSADTWGYRRWAIAWPATHWDLPSPTVGFARWHRNPSAAVDAAGLTDSMPACLLGAKLEIP